MPLSELLRHFSSLLGDAPWTSFSEAILVQLSLGDASSPGHRLRHLPDGLHVHFRGFDFKSKANGNSYANLPGVRLLWGSLDGFDKLGVPALISAILFIANAL